MGVLLVKDQHLARLTALETPQELIPGTQRQANVRFAILIVMRHVSNVETPSVFNAL